MSEDELLHFNPLIAKAFTQFESENYALRCSPPRGLENRKSRSQCPASPSVKPARGVLPKNSDGELHPSCGHSETADHAEGARGKRGSCVAKLGMVPGIEELRAKLRCQPLSNGCVLQKADVPVIDAGHLQAVPPRIALEVKSRCARLETRAPGENVGVDVKPVRISLVARVGVADLIGPRRTEGSEVLPVLRKSGRLVLPRGERRDAVRLPSSDEFV